MHDTACHVPAPFTAYRRVRTIKETCEDGCPHEVVYFDKVVLTATGDTRPFNNGYDTLNTRLYTGADGNIWQAHVSIDFGGNTQYPRDDDKRSYFPRTGKTLARDLAGNPLNDAIPAGPPAKNVVPAPTARAAPRRAARRLPPTSVSTTSWTTNGVTA